MALARARVVFGSGEARAAVAAAIGPVLAGEGLEAGRDGPKLRADVLDMRARMAEHKAAKGVLDVKLARGGLAAADGGKQLEGVADAGGRAHSGGRRGRAGLADRAARQVWELLGA